MIEEKTYYCEKCKKAMRGDMFYSSNNLEKYPLEGKFHQCKACMTLHVDNYNPDTYLWILQEADVPYVPEEWMKLLAKFGKDKTKLTGMTIVGRYLSKMKLKQWCDYRWSDTAHLQELDKMRVKQAMKSQGRSASEIAQQMEEMSFEVPNNLSIPQYDDEPILSAEIANEPEDYFSQQANVPEVEIDLTEEDRTYLCLKWGKCYKPEEWVKLEQLYENMVNSYDVQTAGHIDTLKLICKTSLKANQLIDIGDIEGFQRVSKVYDGLMKSGNFTAAQNKAETGEFVDSIGELIELCEKDGYIERFYVESPNDKVDFVIQDMQRYTRTLIEEETNLSLMVEKALKTNEQEDTNEATDNDDILFEDGDSVIEEIENSIKDQDFIDFQEFLEQEEEETLNLLNGGN